MASYAFTVAAEDDLQEIAHYTTLTWGARQTVRYLSALEAHFAALAGTDAFERAVFDHRDDYRVSRCQHHLVMFVREEARVLILAILHENMNLIERLRQRLAEVGLEE